MRAVVVVSGSALEGPLFGTRVPRLMLWMLDRPFIQHVCEELIQLGVGIVDWVYTGRNGAVEGFVGSGSRWGGQFRHHLTSDKPGTDQAVWRLLTGGEPDEAILLGRADCLPRLRPLDLVNVRRGGATLFGSTGEPGEWRWDGWAVFGGFATTRLANAEWTCSGYEAALASVPGGCERRNMVPPLNVATIPDYLSSTGAEMGRWLRTTPESITRVSRGASVHPKATIVGPVQIGPGAEVAAGAVVGPFAVVGPNSVIDRKAVVTHSVVLSDTYVGERVGLDHSVADHDRLIRIGPHGLPWLDTKAAVASMTDHPFVGLKPTVAQIQRRVSEHLAATRELIRHSFWRRRQAAEAVPLSANAGAD
jgi:NDP-sugar pyrophosphorylase family protein